MSPFQSKASSLPSGDNAGLFGRRIGSRAAATASNITAQTSASDRRFMVDSQEKTTSACQITRSAPPGNRKLPIRGADYLLASGGVPWNNPRGVERLSSGREDSSWLADRPPRRRQ